MDVLELFNAVDIVEGKWICPTLSNTSLKAEKDALNAWMKSAAQMKIILLQCVSDELHQRISGRLSAKEAWDVLTQEFDNKVEDQLVMWLNGLGCLPHNVDSDAWFGCGGGSVKRTAPMWGDLRHKCVPGNIREINDMQDLHIHFIYPKNGNYENVYTV